MGPWNRYFSPVMALLPWMVTSGLIKRYIFISFVAYNLKIVSFISKSSLVFALIRKDTCSSNRREHIWERFFNFALQKMHIIQFNNMILFYNVFYWPIRGILVHLNLSYVKVLNPLYLEKDIKIYFA